jgi:subtilisin-like proprotein convertase family protein
MKTTHFMKMALLTFAAFSLLLIGCSDDDEPASAAFTGENQTAMPILDAPGAAINSTITITEDKKIKSPSKVTIKVNLNHSWCGDLVVELIAPDGSSTTLIKRLGTGGAGDNSDFLAGNILSFNAANETLIDFATPTAAQPILPGDYAPTLAVATIVPTDVITIPMDEFLQDKSVMGDWKLRVQDYSQIDTGSLIGWSMEFEKGALK